MFCKMPYILIGVILLSVLFGCLIPVSIQSQFYAIGLLLKSAIVFILPFLVFGLLFKSAVEFARHASKTVVLLFAAIILSNFFSTIIAGLVGIITYRWDLSLPLTETKQGLLPAFSFTFPSWIGNDKALIAGLLSGVIMGRKKPDLARRIILKIDRILSSVFKMIVYIIPLFLAGFFLKMQHDGIVGSIFFLYGPIFGIVAGSVFVYIGLAYFGASRLAGTAFWSSIKNMIPAALTGFGSMSSAVAMPLTILAAEKNAKNPDRARSLVPATVNVHLVGDCFAIPVFAFAVMKGFGIPEPSLLSYLSFTVFFVMAKFSVAAVPGGGILVMLPLLESHFGFHPSMTCLITSLYILFDPVITVANILGNGAFCMGLGSMKKKRIDVPVPD